VCILFTPSTGGAIVAVVVVLGFFVPLVKKKLCQYDRGGYDLED
jgi:hypothetical protein